MRPNHVFAGARAGLLIRNEYTLEHIPESGALLKRTRLVERQLACGDLIELPEPSENAGTAENAASISKRKG